MPDAYRYKAFISYSHADKISADRLLKDLEKYRVPKRLVGTPNTDGAPIQSRAGLLFRDRDELPAAEDLTAEVKKALTQSEFMIVLCSPAAAASQWVNREIIEFKKLTGERRILSVILAGDPFASEKGAPENECFPPALRFKLGKDGALLKTPAEPLAADFRATGDGPRRGKLKLVAGLLGIGLDALIERDLQRKMRHVTTVTAASILAMLGMSLLTYEAVTARQEAEHHRGEAERQIDFMMTDLWGIFRSMGRSDAAYAIAKNAADYYKSTPFFEPQGLASQGEEKRLSQMFHNWISTALDRGEYGDARIWLNRIWQRNVVRLNKSCGQRAIDPELAPDAEIRSAALVDACENEQDIFDFSQSEFWIGELNRRRGSKSIALAKFEEYKSWSLRLVELDPENPAWQLEAGWGYQNVGTQYLRALQKPKLAWQQFDNAPFHFENSIKLYEQQQANFEEKCPDRSGVGPNCRINDAEVAIRNAKLALAVLYAWRADALLEFAPLVQAIVERKKQLLIYESLQHEHASLQAPELPDSEKIDYYIKAREGEALLALSRLLFDTGHLEEAKSTLSQAREISRVLLERDSESAELLKQSALLTLVEAEFQFDLGQHKRAHALLRQVENTKSSLLAKLRSRTDLVRELRKQPSIAPRLSLSTPRDALVRQISEDQALEERILLGNRYAELLTLRPLVLAAKLALQEKDKEDARVSLAKLAQELADREQSSGITRYSAAQMLLSGQASSVLGEDLAESHSNAHSTRVVSLLAPLNNNTRPETVFLSLKAQYASGQLQMAFETAEILVDRGYRRPNFVQFLQQNFVDEFPFL